jgi:hypothetical protein
MKFIDVDNPRPFITGMRIRAMTGTNTRSTAYVEGLVGRISECTIALLVDVHRGEGSLKSARFSVAGITGLRGSTGPLGPQGLTGATGLPGANGSNGVDGRNGVDGFIPHFGSFYDTTTQTITSINTPKEMTFNQVTPGVNGVTADGVSVISASRVTVSSTGTYNVQFSAQLAKTDAGNDTMDIWLRIDGVDVPWSNTEITIPSSQRQVAAWNFVFDLSAGQYFELMYSSADINSRILAAPAQTNPTRPGIPSVILTVTQVR